MFESIRKHSKIVMFLLFLLVIPSFVLVGIDASYFTEKSPVVARVDGHDITQADWDNAHRVEADRLRAQSPGIDAKLLDSPQARYATLERLVRDRVFAAAIKDLHLTTSDARLAQELQSIPAIAQLRRPDGTLDTQAYQALVAAQGLTPEGFEANVRQDLTVRQVMGGIVTSAFGTEAQRQQAMDALYQRREVQIVRFKPEDFSGKAQPTDAEVQAYYESKPAQFQQTEQATVEYVVLDLDSVMASITVPEDDLKTYYQENLDRLAGKEERRASHILINAPQSMAAADREKAKARAQELLEQVRKSPGSFAELARKNSEDTGSAPSGGDLSFFARGAMVKPFEEAAFALKKGEISDVVETDFGYHIIQLTDVKTPRRPSLEELRPTLVSELKQQLARRKFAEVAETFSNSVYEQADSLQPVAEKLKLKVQTAKGVTRDPGPAAAGPLANPKFLAALFASESIESKRNTEAVETGSSQLVAGRITEYQAAKTLPFDEVKDRARRLLVAQRAADMARQEGQSKLAAWTAAPDSATGLGAPVVIARDQPQGQPRTIIDAALRAKADKLPAWTGVDLGDQGYAVLKVNRIAERPATPEAEVAQQRQIYAQWLGTAEGLAYYELLKQRFKVQIKAPRPSSTEG
ncbi:SurA N-terminal domain-containing protein [Acidovorax lacteus]|uniref:Periplasmic chaperone PpiD n=1 Tax=Acidovorax lacteus TaxID=1924988 RepID=A0ABP8LJ63_9BURK